MNLGGLEWRYEAARPKLNVFVVLSCQRLGVHQGYYCVAPGPPHVAPNNFLLVMVKLKC